MAPPRHRPARSAAGPRPSVAGLRLSIATLILAAGLLSGCRATFATHGRSEVQAAYQFFTLRSDLDRHIRPLDVQSAARQASGAFGLTVIKDKAVGTEAELTARGPGDPDIKRVVVKAKDTGQYTRVSISVRPGGREAYARTFFEAILRELGV